jgi:hypothetical protein
VQRVFFAIVCHNFCGCVQGIGAIALVELGLRWVALDCAEPHKELLGSGKQFLGLNNGSIHCVTMTAVFVLGWFGCCFG